MELVSNLPVYQTVPEKYIFPPDKRPANDIVNHSINLPVIDLRGGRIDSDGQDEIIRDIMKAGKEFGFFQVINHGISTKTIDNMLQVCENFFKMPAQEKERYYSDDMSRAFFLNSSTQYDKSQTRYWRDYLRIACYPIEEFVDQWPEKPENFREILSEYTLRVREIASKILKLIAEGLGLHKDYFAGDLSKGNIKMEVNFYPPCPDPSLTMGLLPHCDRQLITVLAQGTAATGLQAKYKQKWINVKPIPSAFVVNFGHQLEIVTNGILKSVEHRALTNSTVARTSIATMTMPTMDCLIAPAKELVNENNPPMYKEFIFRDFIKAYDAALANREGVLEFFKLY
ncbi:2-oxoglutarate (2OG) and Fe(II)-dependent oxygenase superfamily protein [Rhynchospora pubera]|uniref:2-oxoglutarate (2OG) and Fe(II)-dependent oxygenase superfamily protein n=1 Tax=Rhynchospora pubera TaxID=906938 RepID=A0AAV8EMI9_9POAL|nr:2-oxoglutarate (2OG) and Fe(II)-dependent oxygenase superfamily protein [Rhynchospora pubera]